MNVFVFGSNLAGRHGKGAALTARLKYGAIYGQGVGPQGQSYAIPTKDEYLRTLPLDRIAQYLAEFVKYASENSESTFYLTPIGTGLAGYTLSDLYSILPELPSNVIKTWETEIKL